MMLYATLWLLSALRIILKDVTQAFIENQLSSFHRRCPVAEAMAQATETLLMYRSDYAEAPMARGM